MARRLRRLGLRTPQYADKGDGIGFDSFDEKDSACLPS